MPAWARASTHTNSKPGRSRAKRRTREATDSTWPGEASPSRPSDSTSNGGGEGRTAAQRPEERMVRNRPNPQRRRTLPGWSGRDCYQNPPQGTRSAGFTSTNGCGFRLTKTPSPGRKPGDFPPPPKESPLARMATIAAIIARQNRSARPMNATRMNVATGPSSSDSRNQTRPLRFFPWARPALMSANVNQPTKNRDESCIRCIS